MCLSGDDRRSGDASGILWDLLRAARRPRSSVESSASARVEDGPSQRPPPAPLTYRGNGYTNASMNSPWTRASTDDPLGRSDIVVQSGMGRLLLGRRGPHVPEHTGIEAFDAELRSRLGAPIPVDAPAEVSSAWTRDGFETALAPASVPERSLRRVWRDRLGRRAIPLLLVAPGLSDSACVAVVGPREGEPQEVPPTDLAELINSAKDPM